MIFNCTGGRKYDILLKPLAEFHREFPFSVVIFTTNINGNSFLVKLTIESADLINNMAKHDPEFSSQNLMSSVWTDLTRGSDPVTPIITKTANDTLNHLKDCDSILVCGSLHLVGTMMSIIKVPI